MGCEVKVAPLSSIATYSQGIQVPVEEQHSQKYDGFGRFVRIIDFTNPSEPPRYIKIPSNKYFADISDLVMIRYGSQTAGKIVRGISGYIANNMFKINIISEEADKSYIFRYLSSETVFNSLRGGQSSSTMPAITFSMMDSIKIPLPPKRIQIEISNFFDLLDDRIALLRETNATLEAIAQAIFKSWFVDFDPVKAKAEGREPEGMDAETAALFPSEFEESELGMIPKGWRVGRVADFGEVICGKTPPTSNTNNYGEDVPFITIPDMHGLLVVTSTNRSLSRSGADFQRNKYLPPGSICVSCIATPGLVVLVTSESQTNQQINSVVPSKQWGVSFPLFTLRRIGDAVRSSGSGGSVFHNLSKSGFEALPVLTTDSLLALRFDEIIKPIVNKIIRNQNQSQTLASLRDTLLPRLMSGQLRVPEAERMVEGAL